MQHSQHLPIEIAPLPRLAERLLCVGSTGVFIASSLWRRFETAPAPTTNPTLTTMRIRAPPALGRARISIREAFVRVPAAERRYTGQRLTVKLDFAYHGGFSGALVGWEASLIVGSRGSARCHWFGDSRLIERSKSRYDFRLDASTFNEVRQGLGLLPEPLNSQTIDDAPTCRIACMSGALVLERQRIVAALPATAPEEAFDRLWMVLFSRVRPALLDLGMSDDLLNEASWRFGHQ